MTEQYAQESINRVDTSPFALQTPDATPVDLILGSLTEDGTSLTVVVYGGGSDPAAVSVNNYSTASFTTFTRAAGVVSAGTPSIALPTTGVGPALAMVGVGINAVLRITGPAFPYNHRFDVLRFTY